MLLQCQTTKAEQGGLDRQLTRDTRERGTRARDFALLCTLKNCTCLAGSGDNDTMR